jgi:hypothetical protein
MLASVEDNIQDLLNPEVAKQKFKSSVSMVFAALVGAVILGFFAVAFHDERVRGLMARSPRKLECIRK